MVPCRWCGEGIRFEDRVKWKRAKDKSKRRELAHPECREAEKLARVDASREERERRKLDVAVLKRERMIAMGDPKRLRGIEKTLHEGWARRVKERDGMRCVACGEGGGEMHAHHVRPVSLHPYLSLHVPNGVTLCRECHLGEGGVHGRGEAGEVVLRLRGV